MKCQFCGASNKQGDHFCKKCGKPMTPAKTPQMNIADHTGSVYPKYTKSHRRKGWMIALIVCAVVFLVTDVILLYSVISKNNVSRVAARDDWESSTIITLDSGETAFGVSGIDPQSGGLGTIVEINGQSLLTRQLSGVFFDDIKVPIICCDDTHISVAITSALEGDREYKVTLQYEDEQVSVGNIFVVEIEKENIITQQINSTTDDFDFSSPEISVHIPANALSQEDVLTVDRLDASNISNPIDSFENSQYFEINIGGQHEFSEDLTFNVPLPDGYTATGKTPLAVYFNENTGAWTPVPSKLTADGGSLQIYTSHLSLFGLLPDYSSFEAGEFTVYYIEGQESDLSSNMGAYEAAILISDAVLYSIGQYDAKLAPEYKHKTLPIINNCIVVNSDYKNGAYNPVFGDLYFSTNFQGDNLNTTVAHEIMHAYQDEYAYFGDMFWHKWLTEAMAEYAGKRVANGIVPKIYQGAKCNHSLFVSNEVQYYSASAFIDYLMIKYNKTFKDFFTSYLDCVTNCTTNNQVAEKLIRFFGIQGTLADEYKQFWLDSMTTNTYMNVQSVTSNIDKNVWLKSGQTLNTTINSNIQNEYGQQMVAFSSHSMPDCVPMRYVKVMPKNGQKVDAAGLLLDNDSLQSPADTVVANMGSGIGWEYLGSSPYTIFEMDSCDVLILSILQQGKTSLEVRAVDAIAITKEITKADLDGQVSVSYMFDNIFKECESLLVETDFGDGTVVPQKFGKRTYIEIKETNRYVTPGKPFITGSLFDTTGGKKELIAKVVIPINQELTVTINPDVIEPNINQPVNFAAMLTGTGEVDLTKLTYEWDAGDGSESVSSSDFNMSHSYELPGTYTVSVMVYDENDDFLAKGTYDFTVAQEAIILTASPEAVEPGGNINFSVNVKNDAYTYEYDFGDGSPILTGKGLYNENHPFKEEGRYEVEVNVYNEYGLLGEDLVIVYAVASEVSPTPAPTQEATPEPTAGTQTVCPACNGEGGYWSYYVADDGSGASMFNECENCNGTGYVYE